MGPVKFLQCNFNDPYTSEKYSSVQLPRVSTVGNFFTIALRFAILMTPRANVTVTTIGSPSGMAATARLK